MTTATVHKHEVELAYSFAKQTDIDTALTSTDLTKMARLRAIPLPKVETEILNDRERYSTGSEWALEHKIERHSTALDLSADLDPSLFGVFASLACGQVSSSTVSTSGYSHEITPVSTEDDKALPTTTMVYQQHPDSDLTSMRGLAGNSFDLSIAVGNNERLEMSASLIGTGHLTVTTMSMPASLITQDYLRAGDVEFKLGTDGAETDLSQDLESLSFGYNNNIPDDKSYRAGDGLYRGEMSVGKREVTLSFRVRIDKDSHLYRDWHRAGTSKSMVLTITGSLIEGTTYNSIVIDCPVVIAQSFSSMESGQEVVADIECSLEKDDTFGAPFKITIQNTDSEYLATAS
jgi:hypothetical protein